ncbi:MAG: HAMP domain-containing protein [Acidobacteriales bacterium]|nr:HAMP domain-containing protein [Terriglobales bacterium]
MRSLFLRIFISFWLIMTVITAVNFLQFATSRPLDVENRFSTSIRSSVVTATRLAVMRRETEGNAGYLRTVEDFTNDSKIALWVTTLDGKELSGRTIPTDTLKTLHRYDLRMQVHTDQGEFLAFAEVPLALFPPFHFTGDLLRMLISIAVSGVVCYLLASYLTRPVDDLRRAAQSIAQGDLTARAAARSGNDQISQLVTDFNRMADRLQATMAAQKQMVSDISHELRSPLARLTVALELARARAGEAAQSALNRIDLEATRLNEMIGRILALAQLTSGEIHMNRQVIVLSDLIRDVVEDADFEARARETSVQLHVEPGAEENLIDGYPSLLRSALENVIRNAIAYTSPGTPIEVNHTSTGGRAFIAIRDHGPGVPEEELPKLFRPFYRVDNSRTRHTGGTGLGLAIASRAIALHNGTIEAHNATDGGMIVDIRLPLTTSAQPPRTPAQEAVVS